MDLAVFDIGGTAVKYGHWQKNSLSQTGKFDTPKTFDAMVAKMRAVIQQLGPTVQGVALSAPGAVNVTKGQIDGISAVPYLHHRPIFKELEQAFGLPVTIENDANCAGICEMAIGAGRCVQHAAFIVIGTGVGGAIFIHRQLYKGAHLFGGEFGLMKNATLTTLSTNGTVVKAATRYAEKTGKTVDGKTLFALQEQGDQLAKAVLNDMYDQLAVGLYNLQVSLDPELMIIGGGLSRQTSVIPELQRRVSALLAKEGVAGVSPQLTACHYYNDANLIGAAFNFTNEH